MLQGPSDPCDSCSTVGAGRESGAGMHSISLGREERGNQSGLGFGFGFGFGFGSGGEERRREQGPLNGKLGSFGHCGVENEMKCLVL